MPLKFLKKCRQYNVTSKSLFVISVHHLLDTSTTVDCTISSESKGQECLDNVCQRLLIQQPEFFGLRFIVKGKEDEMKWIDLDRSLSRQLEKYAANTKLYLRVRHYVTTGVRHLSDERYYHFLQLKSDIYEGKIICDIRTAILLALYCRQAEYDSYHQNDKLTKDYLKKSLVLPKNLQGLANDDNLLDSLILDVLQQNAGIQHLTQAQAEEMYIQCCQQLDGYGEERFHAKDTLGNDLLLGLAINGMVVTAENGRQYFPWKDFHTVTIDKRIIKIEQNKLDGSIVGSFIFAEADMARYFWKLCITQHKFFKRYIDEESPSMGDGISITGVDNISSPFGYGDFTDSREDLLLEQQQRATYTPGNGTSTISGLSADHQYLTAPAQHQQQQQQQQLQQQMPHSLMASTSNASGLMTASNISLAASHQSGSASASGVNGICMHSPHGATWLTEYVASTPQLSGSITDTRIQSSSCLDLSNNNLMQQHSSNSMLHAVGAGNHATHMLSADAHERERLKAMLPTYRPAPDYETAVQLKYRTPSIELSNNINNMPGGYQVASMGAATTGVHPGISYHAGSQPDVHQAAGVYGDGILLGQFAPQRYPDVAQPAAALHAHHHMNVAAAVASSHNVHGNPSSAYMDTAQRLHVMRSKPPPPYPVNRLSSSSTPDLAVATHRPLLGYRAYVSGSSPDLVSNRNLLNNQYQYAVGNGGMNTGGGGPVAGTTNSSAAMLPQYNNSYINHMAHSQHFLPAHGTFENLNMIEEQPSIMSQLRQSAMNQAAAAQAANNNKNYERNSPTLPIGGYRPLPAAQLHPQQQQQQQQSQQHQQNAPPPLIVPPIKNITPAPLQRNTMNGSIEPIYENVPLPQFNVTSSQRNADHRSSGSSSYTTNDAIRNRTSSIQSAPGGIQPPVPATRHHNNNNNQSTNNPPKQQQQHQIQQLQQQQQHYEQDEISMNIKKFGSQTHADRAASTEFQYLDTNANATSPTKRAMRSASAAPTLGVTQTPPQRHHQRVAAAASLGATTMSRLPQPQNAMESTVGNMRHFAANSMHDDAQSLQQQFNTMNLSASSSMSTTTGAGSFYNHTFNKSGSTTANNTTGTLSNTSTMNSSKEPGKRKKRWNLLGRSKTPDKQKSATLGREKSVPNLSANKVLMAQDDLNIRSRWSTGVPKLQPISGQFSKDKLCQILNEKLNDVQLFMEFENIPKRRHNAIYDCALMEENAMKNFDPHFLPYDDNRVRLTPTMENRHGYVNASHISATVGTKQRFYIVAQSPHEELVSRIFWQCVWEADVYLIVQLSEDLNYIPPTSNQRMEFGQFQVYQEFSQTTDRCTTSKLRLYHIQSRRYRSVWHLSYTDWAEQNCPRDVNHFLDFLEELNSVRMASINEVPPGHNTNPPVLIHCLEGGGRSGVTLTADLLLYTLDHNEDLDIPRVVGQLRHQRDSIIPSLAQYKFIYSLLITYLKRTRLI